MLSFRLWRRSQDIEAVSRKGSWIREHLLRNAEVAQRHWPLRIFRDRNGTSGVLDLPYILVVITIADNFQVSGIRQIEYLDKMAVGGRDYVRSGFEKSHLIGDKVVSDWSASGCFQDRQGEKGKGKSTHQLVSELGLDPLAR